MSRPTEIRITPVTSKKRRTVLKAGATLLLSVFAPLPSHAAQIMAVRVWPADDYTRVTLENDSDLKTTHFLIRVRRSNPTIPISNKYVSARIVRTSCA